eukprot:gene3774-15588_t
MFLRRVFTGAAAPRSAIAWGRFYSVAAGDKVGVSYVGTLEDGTVFDQSRDGRPLVFDVGEGQMIKGFDAGVLGMNLGDKKTLVLPPAD